MTEQTIIIPVKLPNGAVVGVEATMIEGTEEDRRIALQMPSFDGVTQAIEGMTEILWSTLKKIGPQRATLEFGFEVGIQNGQLTGFFVKGSGKANMKVTLEWAAEHSA